MRNTLGFWTKEIIKTTLRRVGSRTHVMCLQVILGTGAGCYARNSRQFRGSHALEIDLNAELSNT